MRSTKLTWLCAMAFLALAAVSAVAQQPGPAAGAPVIEPEEPEEGAAPDPALVDLLDRLQKKYAGTTEYEARFVQITELRSIGSTEESSGVVRFRRPNKMRWDYESPEKKSLIADGTTVWFYNPAEKVVYTQPFNEMMTSRTPIALLSGAAKLTEEFLVGLKSRDAEAKTTRLYLIPKAKDVSVAEVLITIADQTLEILDTRITDAFGNPTLIRFSDAQLNGGIDPSLFAFTPPEGVDVYSMP